MTDTTPVSAGFLTLWCGNRHVDAFEKFKERAFIIPKRLVRKN